MLQGQPKNNITKTNWQAKLPSGKSHQSIKIRISILTNFFYCSKSTTLNYYFNYHTSSSNRPTANPISDHFNPKTLVFWTTHFSTNDLNIKHLHQSVCVKYISKFAQPWFSLKNTNHMNFS